MVESELVTGVFWLYFGLASSGRQSHTATTLRVGSTDAGPGYGSKIERRRDVASNAAVYN
jgi:hypothetical protein